MYIQPGPAFPFLAVLQVRVYSFLLAVQTFLEQGFSNVMDYNTTRRACCVQIYLGPTKTLYEKIATIVII